MKTNLQRYVMQRLEEGGGCQGVLYSTTVQRCVQPRCWGTGGTVPAPAVSLPQSVIRATQTVLSSETTLYYNSEQSVNF